MRRVKCRGCTSTITQGQYEARKYYCGRCQKYGVSVPKPKKALKIPEDDIEFDKLCAKLGKRWKE